MNEIEYKIFACESGHTWDVFGTVNDDGAFVPDDIQTYLCPTCDGLMTEEREPENLT